MMTLYLHSGKLLIRTVGGATGLATDSACCCETTPPIDCVCDDIPDAMELTMVLAGNTFTMSGTKIGVKTWEFSTAGTCITRFSKALRVICTDGTPPTFEIRTVNLADAEFVLGPSCEARVCDGLGALDPYAHFCEDDMPLWLAYIPVLVPNGHDCIPAVNDQPDFEFHLP